MSWHTSGPVTRHRGRVRIETMKKAYWIDGRLLTERDLQDIRAQLEGFKSVTAISDEMRDDRDRMARPCREVAAAQNRAIKDRRETPAVRRQLRPFLITQPRQARA